MNKPLSHCLFFTLAFLICGVSCKQKISDADLGKLMGSYYHRKLILPGNLKPVNPDAPGNADTSADWTILHYFSADCDKCINGLISAGTFIEKNKDKYKNVKYKFIASGASDVYIKEAISRSHFRSPVYFDDNFGYFKIINKLPLDDDMYNTMLIDKRQEIVLFGGFFENQKSQELLDEIVNP